MTNDDEKLDREIRELKAQVQRMRDEVRVRLHLGAMDARDAYREIERETERIGSAISQTSQHAWQSVLVRLKTLAASFNDGAPKPEQR
jgi:hypothetical protein